MDSSPKLRLPFQRKRQRWPFVIAALVVVVIAGWQVLKGFIDAERYRPVFIERIERLTGLPVTIDRLELVMFPVPNLLATNVSIGHDDFKATSTSVAAYARLGSLLRGVLDINSIEINDLQATLPAKPGDLKARIDGIAAARKADAGSGGGSGVKLAVRRIDAPNAIIQLVGGDGPFYSGPLSATDVLSETITISANGSAPIYGPTAGVNGAVTLERKPAIDVGLGVHGNITVTDIQTTALFNSTRIPPALATVRSQIERTGPSQVKISLEGDAKPTKTEGLDLSAVAGQFNGVAWWDEGTITVNGLNWSAPGLQFVSDITIDPDGGVATSVKEATANREGLHAFLAVQTSENYRVAAMENGQARAQDLLIGLTADKRLRLVSGKVTFSGVELSLKEGQRAIAGIEGELDFVEDAIALQKLSAEGLTLSGTIVPDLEKKSATVNLNGDFALTRERLAMVMPMDVLKAAKGAISLQKVTGTFSSEGGVPDDLSITGKLSDGSFVVESPSWNDTFSNVSADFTATPGAIKTTARANTKNLGGVSISGNYAIAERKWNGTIRGNLAKMDLPFLKQEAAKKVAPGILAGYGESEFAMNLSLPGEKQAQLSVDFNRKGDPGLTGKVVMLKGKESWELGDLTVDATLPGPALQPMLPDTMRVEGLMPVHFVRNNKAGVFDATIDLKSNAVKLNDYLYKREGIAAGLVIHGTATPGNWAAKTVTITCLDQKIVGQFTEKRFEVPQFDISAGALAALLPEGTQAGGRIRGSAATQPVEADATLDGVNVALADGVSIDKLAGGVVYKGESVAFKNLAVEGANSSFVVDLTGRGGTWSGALTGSRLDVNALLATRDKLQSATASVGGGDPETESDSGFTGNFDLNVNHVFLRNGELLDAYTNIKAADGDMEFANLSANTRGGKAKGWLRMTRARGERPATTAMSLVLDGVDLAAIDDFALENPRETKGPTWGTVDIAYNTGPGLPVFSGANGSVKLTSRDGSFGKIGIATKVLAVLRTLEITRLRLPKLKDQGLSFDTCEADATFTNGIMTLNKMHLTTPSYVINAVGTIDFNREQSDLLVHVDLLETVLGPADLVPGLSSVVDMFRNTGGLRILVTGPPTDPETSYAFGPKPDTVTDEVRDAVKAGGNTVKDEVLERATDVLRRVLTK